MSRTMPASMSVAWESGDFTGPQKAVTRVTIQKAIEEVYPVGQQAYATLLHSRASAFALELPNIKSVKWDRTVDGDAATCTIELWNVAPLPPGQTPDAAGHLDQPGYYTYDRGATLEMRSRWAVGRNEWTDTIMPDRVIRIYQGYGVDYTVFPENDPHLVLQGVFIIDDVTYTADGTITVECRDFARLLMDSILFPPVVPLKQYPLKFDAYHQVKNPDHVTTVGSWFTPHYSGSSITPYYGVNGNVYGHHGVDAFDSSENTFWLSVGNYAPSDHYSYEWVQGSFSARTISAVKVHVWGGPYTAYLSVQSGGKWKGVVKIPYRPPSSGINNGSAITYSQSKRVDFNGTLTFTFPPQANITAVRVTFHNLYNSGIGKPFVYRAGVRSLQVATKITTTHDGGTHTEGDYGDYSQLVKRFLAYGGFYWPRGARQKLTGKPVKNFYAPPTIIHGDTLIQSPATDDPFLGAGRVWGDIQNCGTAGVATLGVEIWDKKPVLDGINYIKDILGFLFFVDENGAAIFRSPNTFKLGNWRSDSSGTGTTRVTGTGSYVTIDENHTLIDLRVKLSSRSLRERVFVANAAGTIGATAQGFMPSGSGNVNFRRVGGWTDQNFKSDAECRIMAELIKLRQLFTFRQNSVRIPAYPGIQCDDQVKIYEQITGEAYFHYVRGISSEWDAETGEWTYDLTTSWLGSSPTTQWAFDPALLSSDTRTFLAALGQV